MNIGTRLEAVMQEHVAGRIMQFTYHKGALFIAKMKMYGQTGRKTETICGECEDIQIKDEIEADGVWVTHPRYGVQFKARRVFVTERCIAVSYGEAIRRYLADSGISRIGPVAAGAVVKALGEERFVDKMRSSKALRKVTSLTRRQKFALQEFWSDVPEKEHLAKIFLRQYGFTQYEADQIFDAYGYATQDIMKTDPYRCARDVSRIKFESVDRFALNLGIVKDSAQRIQGGLYYCAGKGMHDNGDIYTEGQDLVTDAAKKLELPEPAVKDELLTMLHNGSLLAVDTNRKDDLGETVWGIYLPKDLHQEVTIATKLLHNMECPPSYEIKTKDIIKKIEKKAGVPYDDVQEEAILKALTNKVTIITGGPGTGKTTLIQGIITGLEIGYKATHRGRLEEPLIKLAAPTGKAARRMKQQTNHEAQTIHMLLGLTKEGGARINEKNPLVSDVLIVDECSMIAQDLMCYLVNALSDDTRVILVGDVDQLPSVGPGSVLKDLINSQKIPTIRLTKVYRQEDGSKIIENAHRINDGLLPVINNKASNFMVYNVLKDVKDQGNSEAIQEAAANKIVHFVSDSIPVHYHLCTDQIQVLSPMKKGAAGTTALNLKLQEAINPPSPAKEEVCFRGTVFRVGDRVMQNKNDYDKCVRNGDVGRITSIADETELGELDEIKIITVRYGDNDEGTRLVQYGPESYHELQLAYAITIHKSQGSEYPFVVISLLDAHWLMLQRNLLYTAVTRASKYVLIVGTQSAIRRAVETVSAVQRKTMLQRWLAEGTEYAQLVRQSLSAFGATQDEITAVETEIEKEEAKREAVEEQLAAKPSWTEENRENKDEPSFEDPFEPASEKTGDAIDTVRESSKEPAPEMKEPAPVKEKEPEGNEDEDTPPFENETRCYQVKKKSKWPEKTGSGVPFSNENVDEDTPPFLHETRCYKAGSQPKTTPEKKRETLWFEEPQYAGTKKKAASKAGAKKKKSTKPKPTVRTRAGGKKRKSA